MTTFVDTGGWLSVVIEADDYHEIGVLYYEELIARREKLVTSDFVLDETVTRVRYDTDHATAIAFLDLLGNAQTAGSLTVLRVDDRIWQAAETLFRQYHDHEFSFTDCTSFVLASQVRADAIFGFDQDFLMFGFNVRPLW